MNSHAELKCLAYSGRFYALSNSAPEGRVEQDHIDRGVKDGRGEFYSTAKRGGRTVLTRGVWSDITPTSHRYEIAFSRDGGRSWAPVFKACLTRLK